MNRPTILLVALLAGLTTISSAPAHTDARDLTHRVIPTSEEAQSSGLASTIRDARQDLEDGDHHRAARGFADAAEASPDLQDYLLTQAGLAAFPVIDDDEEMRSLLEGLLETDALSAGFPGGAFLLSQLQAAFLDGPSPDALGSALAADAEEACPFLMNHLTGGDGDQAFWELAHSFCIDDDSASTLARLTYEPSDSARLDRAYRLFRAVRFQDALAELDRIDLDQLTSTERCQAHFRRARSHVRLRQPAVSDPIYRRIVEECTDDETETLRVRSLYAVGNRQYQTGRLDESERFFTTLFQEYPYRTHADDALFFLARIARRRGDTERERELLYQALTEYPNEDMVHEMAWEVFEPLFRDGEYQEFIDQVTALPLPPRDREYFSQGRLEYFVGAAHARLDQTPEALRYWQLAWVKYPFSFYGYLAHLRIREAGESPQSLRRPSDERVSLWLDDDFLTTGAGVLAMAGDFQGACDVESARLRTTESITASDRWRQALLCHHAERYPVSHNIARRQIPGRPWAFPLSDRMVRWQIAWPDPFGLQLAQAVEAHGPDSEELRVLPALASAIMREESSFIEDIVSWAGAVGLMQLMPATARGHSDVVNVEVTPETLKRAEVNLPIGVDHIAHLSRRFDGHPVLMTAAYNAGGGRVVSWLRRQPADEIALFVEDIPFLETRNYTKRVIGSYGAYQILYSDGDVELDDRVALPAR